MLVRYLDTIGPSVMNVICVVVPIIGFLIGLFKGFVNRSVRVLEGALIIVLSLILKNPISSLLYRFIPFVDFEYKVLNVLLYEFVSFVLLALVLVVVVHIINRFISIIEKVVGFIISIGVPTGILGALVSLVEFTFYLYVFIFVVFFLSAVTSSPIDSSLANKYYYKMPVLRRVFGNTFDACIEVGNEINSNESPDKINYDSMKILLEHHFITKDNARYIIENNKIKIANSKELLSK